MLLDQVFQSAPRLSARGILGITPTFREFVVSIRPPPFGEGNRPQEVFDGGALCFNPPPAFRRGESFRGLKIPKGKDVSIRPPPFGEGNPGRIGTL